MNQEQKEFTPFFSANLVLYMILIAATGAVLLFILQIKEAPFSHYLIFSESIGICQSLCIIILFYIFRKQNYTAMRFTIQCFVGLFTGSLLGIQIGTFFCLGEGLFSIKGFETFKGTILLNILIGTLVSTGCAVRAQVFMGSETRLERADRITKKMFSIRSILIILLFNMSIATLLYAVKFKNIPFYQIIVISQCIGLSISFFVWAGFYFFGAFHPLIPSIGGVLTGSVFGPFIGSLIVGKTELIFNRDIDVYGRVILIGLLFGVIGSIYFYIRAQLSAAQAKTERIRARTIETQKEFAETSLKLLQAQIEPHFLFNTLSNIISLFDTDVSKAKAMLIDLTQYLRTSLARTRSEKTTLGQEMDMIQAYLNILKIRMGDRLVFSIDLPETLKKVSFPSMLIQPLVENAVKHGIDPKVEGGSITITAEQKAATLTLVVADTGRGQDNSGAGTKKGTGVGLQNIRERLHSLFGQNAWLSLEENQPYGIKAVIEVPYEQ